MTFRLVAFLSFLFLLPTAWAGASELRGDVEILVEDDFVTGKSKRQYWLATEKPEKRVRLEFKKAPENLEPGNRIKVSGKEKKDQFVVERWEPLPASTERQKP